MIVNVGDEIISGSIMGIITDEEISLEEARNYVNNLKINQNDNSNEGDILYTEKAKLLALKNNLNIFTVPHKSDRISEEDVLNYLNVIKESSSSTRYKDIVDDIYENNKVEKIAIIGAGNGAVQIIDTLLKIPKQRPVMLFDDNRSIIGKKISGIPIVDIIDTDLIEKHYKNNSFDSVIISVSTSIPFRVKVFNELKNRDIPFTNVVHPTVILGTNVYLGEGNVILAFCHIGACSVLGNNNFISAFCNIEHHVILGDHCSFGPAVITSSKVNISSQVRFGTGIFIEPFINIGEKSMISSGCIITKDIPQNSIVKNKMNYLIRKIE